MQTIAILKEPENESRVCLLPDAVKRIVSTMDTKVWVEKDAGKSAGFSDDDYIEAGANIAENGDLLSRADLIFSINHLYKGEPLESEKSFVGIFNVLYHTKRLEDYQKPNVSAFSLDMVPRTTKAQGMDVLSSMSSLSGYKAVIKAAELYGSVIPMFTTAAGTLRPATVLVLGAGVAGLQAIATAKRLGAMVEAFDVRVAAGEEVRSLGAKFIEVEGATENREAGGYAVTQTPEYQAKQKELLDKHLATASIVVSTANIPGKTAPLLIDAETVAKMKPGSVIVDLASEQGGNCALTEDEKMVVHHGVKIIGSSFLSREMPYASAQMLSNNYLSFYKHLHETNGSEKTDPILSGCKIVENGEVIHPYLLRNKN